MTKAIVIHEYGGPEVLQWENIEVGTSRTTMKFELNTRLLALNFRDTYHRSGSYGMSQVTNFRRLLVAMARVLLRPLVQPM